MEKIHLTELIGTNILRQIQKEFSRYTGMAVLFMDMDGVPVMEASGVTKICADFTANSEIGRRKCEKFYHNAALKAIQDGEPYMCCCHKELINCAMPIIIKGSSVGSFVVGQVRGKDMEELEHAANFLSKVMEVLAESAHRNYATLQESRRVERAARSQSEFVMNLSMNMKKNMKEWMNHIEQMTGQVDSRSGQDMRNLLLQGTEVYSMVEDAIEYIKMSEGKVVLSESNYCTRELLEQIVARVKSYLNAPGIEIEIQKDQSLPEYMLGDPGRIGQIMHKLLVNCVNETKEGKIIIRAACQKVSYASMLVISIEALGMQMSKEQLKDIEEYMRNEKMSTLEKEQSMELGLSIVRLLLRQMSGKLKVTSNEKQGTEFIVTLPQLEVKEGALYGV